MLARECDRCKKLYNHFDGGKLFKETEKANACILIDKDLQNKYWTRKNYDFCPDCMREFEKFLYGNTEMGSSGFNVVLHKDSRAGMAQLDGDIFDVYISNYTEETIMDAGKLTKKRAINIIEI